MSAQCHAARTYPDAQFGHFARYRIGHALCARQSGLTAAGKLFIICSMIRLLPRIALLIALLTLGAIPARAIAEPVRHAVGTFTVAITPQAAIASNPVQPMVMSKQFTGPLEAKSDGVMAAIGTPRPGEAAAYAAIERVTGKLDGREGSFILLQRGTMTRAGTPRLEVSIADDSGTGALIGIAGSLTITVTGGVHHYDLAYTLP
jgi:hypothetical protein